MKSLHESIKTLKHLKVGESAVVRGIRSSNDALRNRLLSLGLVEGREVVVTTMAPLGGAIGISLLGFSLALRLSEAEAVSVLIN